MEIEATYSAEDNKLRLYASERLDAETYEKVKTAGFKWAPRQELFVAPRWTPAREDLARELAGSIGPEASTMAERAEIKAARLDGIATRRAGESDAFRRASDQLCERFAGGQPILVGHHSERKARKDSERADNLMRKSAEAHKAIDYWQYRAEGVERHANYKNDPGVRSRRIATLLKELRDCQRTVNQLEKRRELWSACENKERATAIANIGGCGLSGWNDWGDLTDGKKEWEPVKAENLAVCALNLAPGSNIRRSIDHTLNRLSYERGQLGDVARFSGELTPVIIQGFARTHGADKPKATKRADPPSNVVYFCLESPVNLPAHIAEGCKIDLPADEWRDLMQSCGYEVPQIVRRKSTVSKKAPLINPTPEDAAKLQKFWNENAARFAERKSLGTLKPAELREISQARYSAHSGGSYSPFETIDLDASGRKVRETWRKLENVAPPVVCRVRIAPGPSQCYAAQAVVLITDKPGKALPVSFQNEVTA